jgi:DNA-binding MarR family transcriptional regulator
MLPSENPPTRIAWKVKDVNHRHTYLLRNIHARFGLHIAQPRILLTIDELNGATQNQIADAMQVSPATLSMSIKRMQKAGLLEKAQDEHDLRCNKIKLSQAGKAAMDSSLQALMQMDCQMMQGFTPEEIELLGSFLDRMFVNLSNIPVDPEAERLQLAHPDDPLHSAQ